MKIEQVKDKSSFDNGIAGMGIRLHVEFLRKCNKEIRKNAPTFRKERVPDFFRHPARSEYISKQKSKGVKFEINSLIISRWGWKYISTIKELIEWSWTTKLVPVIHPSWEDYFLNYKHQMHYIVSQYNENESMITLSKDQEHFNPQRRMGIVQFGCNQGSQDNFS